MEKLIRLIKDNNNITLYLPESFEWLILKSGIIIDNEVREILDVPSEYIDSQQYFSWERFFTSILIKKTTGTYLKYTKKELNPSYQNHKIMCQILEVIKWVDFQY